MEGLEAIIRRIMADAREEASDLDRASEKEKNELLQQNSEVCKQMMSAAQAAGAAKAATIVSRARSMAGLDRRKAILAARQEVIKNVLNRAMAQLCQMPEAEKVALYRQLILRSNLTEGLLILCSEDQPLGRQLIEQPDIKLVLSEQPGMFSGGLVIRSGLIEENLTYETLLKNKNAELVGLAASVLFQQLDDGRIDEKGEGKQ